MGRRQGKAPCVYVRGVPSVLAEAADCEAERKQLMSGALSVF